MFKVEIRNIQNELTNWQKYETENEANEWIAKQISKEKHWGRFHGEREVFVKGQNHPDEFDYPDSLVRAGSQFFWTDGDGDSWAKIILEPEYTYELIDLSQDAAYVQDEEIKALVKVGSQVEAIVKSTERYLIGHLTSIDANDAEIEAALVTFAPVYDAIKKKKAKQLKKEIAKITVDALITEKVKAHLIYMLKDITD